MISQLVTIIIPAYNAENVIERAVCSILNQTHKAIELIVVNDGSEDGTLNLLKNLAATDSRLIVIDKPNGGVSSARNAALSVAKGDYVAFVDADDWVGEQYVEHMLSAMGPDTGLVISSTVFHDENGTNLQPSFPRVVENGDFDALYDGTNMARRTSPWGKLYRMDVIRENGLLFPEKIHMGEDACFLYSYLLLVNKVVMIDAHDYHYYYAQEGSLTKKVNSFESENLAYSTISSLIKSLILEKHICSGNSVESLNTSLCDYQRRTLNAAYCDSAVRREQRLSFLNSQDWRKYVQLYCSDGLKGKIKAILLKSKQWMLYDVVRKITT